MYNNIYIYIYIYNTYIHIYGLRLLKELPAAQGKTGGCVGRRPAGKRGPHSAVTVSHQPHLATHDSQVNEYLAV